IESEINFLPQIVELKDNDSIKFNLFYKDTNNKLFINCLNYQLFINIPYLKYEYFWHIWDEEDPNYHNIDDYLGKGIKSVDIDMNCYQTHSLKPIDYKKYSKMRIDKCIQRLLQMALIDNILKCNCKIEKK
ncbi:MAG: hypothetical protein ABSG15_06850, partial [FCB group bacterium]